MSKKDLGQDEVRYFTHKVDLVRSDGDGESMPVIRGYAAKFGVLSEFMYGVRERILEGAFDDVLEDDCRALVNHEGIPLARTKSGTLKLSVDSVGLRYEFTPADTSDSKTLIEALERGDIDQSSFRFGITSKGYDYVEDEKDGTVREISKISALRDVSVVTFPAYPDATAEMQRSLEDYKRSQEPEEHDSKPMEALADALTKLAEMN